MTDFFQQLTNAYASSGLAAALDAAESQFRDAGRYHELFEVLRMKSRHRLGLQIMQSEPASLAAADQRALEDGLLAACRDVGYALLRSGQIQESWMYLRHLDENARIIEELRDVEITEQNLDQVLGLLLHEGLDCERGYQLVLERYGTCNAITTLQSTMYGRAKSERRAAGRLLVAHVHQELLENVKAHVAREEATSPNENRLTELMHGRDYLFADGAYHIDTSHLSSTVQVAGELVDRPSLELALDLARYGQRLDSGLQYASDAPFEDTYAAYGQFFAAQLGQDVEQSLAFFREQAEATDAHQQGTFPIETYIDLLARVGRPLEAIEATIKLIPVGTQTTGRSPSLYDLSEQLGDFTRYRELCQERRDMLGYLISLEKQDRRDI